MKEVKRYSKGHFINIGLILGIPLSVIAGIAFGNMAYGPVTGITTGLILGWVIERIFNPDPVEPNPEAQKKLRKLSLYGLVVGLLFLLTFTAIYFSRVN